MCKLCIYDICIVSFYCEHKSVLPSLIKCYVVCCIIVGFYFLCIRFRDRYAEYIAVILEGISLSLHVIPWAVSTVI